MAIRVVQLGSPRETDEGLRLGTVRRPPRGVPKSDYASKDFYDVWLPNLSPSPELMKQGKSAQDDRSWALFKKKFRAERNKTRNQIILRLPRKNFIRQRGRYLKSRNSTGMPSGSWM